MNIRVLIMDKYRLSITVTVLALVVSLAVLVPNSTFIKPVNHITITSTVTKTITITYTPQANGNLTLTNQYPSFTLPQLVQSIPEGTGNYRRNTVMFEGNPNHNYVVPTRTGYFIVNLTWGVVVPPGIYDDLLIVTTSGPYNFSISSFPYNIGSVCALNLTNGNLAWCRVFPNQIMTQPIIVNGILIIGLGNNVLTPTYRGTGVNYIAALNVTNGNVLWNYTTIGEDMPTPAYYRGLVIESDGSGDAFALNITNGKPIWVDELGSYDSMSSLLLVNDVVYFGTATTFWAINATNGNVIWSDYLYGSYNNMGGLDDSSPAYYRGIVVTSFTVHYANDTMSVMLIALNATDGETLWVLNEGLSKVTPNLEAPPVVIYSGIVLHDSPVGLLYAVNVSNGHVLWTFRTGPTLSNAVVVYGRYVLIQNREGELFVLTINGSLIKEVQTPVVPGAGNILATGNSVILVGINGVVESIPLFPLLH